MKKVRLVILFAVLLAVMLELGFLRGASADFQAATSAGQTSREDAYRANNLGVALLEQFKHKEAADAFRRALQIDPKLGLARINLSIALFYLPDLPAAQKEAQAASVAMPNAPQPFYLLGLIAKQQSKPEEAIAAFQRVLKIDPNDVGANINLGQLYAQERKYPEAIAAFRLALALEPYNSTALYNLGTALIRAGQRDEGQRVIQRFQEYRTRGSGSSLGNNYLEQGRYAEAIASTGAEPELVDRTTPAVSFTGANANFKLDSPAAKAATVLGARFKSSELNDSAKAAIAAGLGGAATFFDYDGDGDLDLFWISGTEQHLYRNDGGKFTDVSAQSGALAAKGRGIGIAAVAGDYDNDGRPDLFVARDNGLALYHNDGGGKFSDVTAASGIPAFRYLPGACAFVDVDHDGDLDVFVAGLADLSKTPKGDAAIFPTDFEPASNLLLRNDGNGKFTDVTATAKLNVAGHAVAVVPTDFNNRRDIDLLVVNYGSAPNLFSNQRDETFRDVASEVGLAVAGDWSCVAAGDLNKDGYTDFFFGRTGGTGLLAISDGKEKFKTTAAPNGSEAARAAQFLDYDNDGLLDCLVITEKGLRVFRNLGDSWNDVTEKAVTPSLGPDRLGKSRLLSAADLDGDGDTDLVLATAGGELDVARNEGGNRNRALRVDLAGKVSNRSGIGSKIEIRAGSLVQKLESYAASPPPAPADLLFGLGQRAEPDAIRILWPAGIIQAETEFPKPAAGVNLAHLPVTELDRKPSSCPFLYTWNGDRFEFITDFMGGGEMGYLEEPGRYNKPDPVEYVRIRNDQLKPRNGRYELRVTNELEETLFADRFQLIAVDHPRGVEVYPNEGMSEPPRPFKLFATRDAHPPLSATDDHGHDVLDRITRFDRRYPDDFALDRIRGYAAEHTLTMKLAEDATPRRSPERVLLLMTGWTDYAWSSDNVAASQAGKSMTTPALQVRDQSGAWRTVIEDIGIPVGRPQTVTVDLTGKFLSRSREVRIVTNMRVYWDQILVDVSGGNFPLNLSRLDPTEAILRWRGFSIETTPDGREPIGYDYQHVVYNSPWKVMSGHYTRLGDVLPLLTRTDDMFVIARPGDEIELAFAAGALPRLPNGWTRTFLLYSDGFSKEMDINSASPDQVEPLPFHGMSRYPYTFPEHYPMTAERRSYLARYNTRWVAADVPSIDATISSVRDDQTLSRRGEKR